LPRVRWAEGEFSAHFPAPGNARNAPCRAMTAAAFGAGGFGHFRPASAVGGMGITGKDDFSRKVRSSMHQLPHDSEKIRPFYRKPSLKYAA
jgi:hypothetical protein